MKKILDRLHRSSQRERERKVEFDLSPAPILDFAIVLIILDFAIVHRTMDKFPAHRSAALGTHPTFIKIYYETIKMSSAVCRNAEGIVVQKNCFTF